MLGCGPVWACFWRLQDFQTKRELNSFPTESEITLGDREGNYDVVVEVQVPGSGGNGVSGSTGDSSTMEELSRVQMPLFFSIMTTAALQGLKDFSAKPPIGSAARQTSLMKSSSSKPR